MTETDITNTTYNQLAPAFAARWGDADVPALAIGRERLAALLQPGAQVLDVGCGPGRDTARLSLLGLQMYGLDRSMAMLTETCQRHDRPVTLADMRYIPVASGSFDGLWVCASFLHIPKRDALLVLCELRRVLRPNGVLYLGVKEGVGERWVEQEAGSRFFVFYNMQELDQLLARSGFTLREQWFGEDHAGRSERWINLLASAM